MISARELHINLNVGKDFTTWIKNRISKYRFENNQDYILTFTKIRERKNVVKYEYYLIIDTAKEICMIENNEIGRKKGYKIKIYVIKLRYYSIDFFVFYIYTVAVNFFKWKLKG